MSKYRVWSMGREFVVIADSEIGAVKKLRDSRALKDASTSVREWYMRTYPSDELGKEIRPDLTWYDAYEAKFIYKVADMYRIIGVEDSIVRERIEAQLNRIKKDLGKNSIEDEHLSPMTYKKLKEYGYNSNQWKNWTQEQANSVIASRQNKIGKSKSEKKEVKNSKWSDIYEGDFATINGKDYHILKKNNQGVIAVPYPDDGKKEFIKKEDITNTRSIL